VEIRRYILLLRRWAWLIVAVIAIATAATYVVTARQPRLYRAKATLIINQGQSISGTSNADVQASQLLATTYAQVAVSTPVLRAAAQTLGLGTNAVSTECACLLSGTSTVLTVTAGVPLGTQLVNVNAEAGSAEFAASGANAVAAAFSQAIRDSQQSDADTAVSDLQQQIQVEQAAIQKTTSDIQAAGATQPLGAPASSATPSPQVGALQSTLAQEESAYASLQGQLAQLRLLDARSTNAVKLISPGVPPTTPFSPRVLLNTVLGALFGGVIGLGIAFLIEYIDDRVRSPEVVERAIGDVSTLGIIERLDAGRRLQEGVDPSLRLLPGAYSASTTLEVYRRLRSNLEFAAAGRPCRTLAITSASAGEGKSTTATNLAIVLAQTGKRVLLVDSDLRRPALHRLFGLPNGAGFSTLFLMDRPAVLGLAQQTEYENLLVLTSGPLPPNPAELLSSPKVFQIDEALRETADVVIYDTPPLLAVVDSSEIAARSDGVVLVVDTGRTRSGQLARAKTTLDRANATVYGVVLNKLSKDRLKNDYYYHYYSYASSYGYGKYGYGSYNQTAGSAGNRRTPPLPGSHPTGSRQIVGGVPVLSSNGQNGHHLENGHGYSSESSQEQE
jgi:non-specific protein-tyrosine kinase